MAWLIAIFLISPILAILFASQATLHVKVGVYRWLDTGLNPLNLMLRPDALEPKRLMFRWRSFASLLLMLCSGVLIAVLS